MTALAIDQQIDNHGRSAGTLLAGGGCRGYRPAGEVPEQDRPTLRGRAGFFDYSCKRMTSGACGLRTFPFTPGNLPSLLGSGRSLRGGCASRRQTVSSGAPMVLIFTAIRPTSHRNLCRALKRRGSLSLDTQISEQACKHLANLSSHSSSPFATRSRSRTHRSDGAISRAQEPFAVGAEHE